MAKKTEVKKEVEEVKPTEEIIYKMTVGVITLNNKMYQLLVGTDKKWYKCEAVGTTQLDARNNSAVATVWSDDITPITEKEFNSYFKPKKVK